MTRFPTPHRRGPGSRAGAAVSGALVRVPVSDPGWTERLPPAPAGVTVTVSLSSPAAEAEHGGVLRFLGYQVVAPSGVRAEGGDVADFVVPADGPARHEPWWNALVAQATRAYPLAFGPVLKVLDQALRPHLAVGGHPPRGAAHHK